MATKTDWRTELWNDCVRLAEDAWGQLMRNEWLRLYVVGTPERDGCFKELRIDDDSTHAPCVIGQQVPNNLTREQLAYWIRDRLGRVNLVMIRDLP